MRRVIACQRAPHKSRKLIRTHRDRYRRAHIRSLTFRRLGYNRGTGYLLLRGRGQLDQWPCMDALVFRESGWSVTATNPSSGAYGLPQSLPGDKMASAGPDWRSNPRTQLRWMAGYVAGRYGSFCAADGFQRANRWY